MKCEIIRDLLPSYIDGLTSPESNDVIEEHLKECHTCEKYLKEMNQELSEKEIINRDKEIEPFIKISEKTFYKIALSVFVTLLVCGFLHAMYVSHYHYATDALAEDVKEIQYENIHGVTRLTFIPANENTVLIVGYGGGETGEEEVVINGETAFKSLHLIKKNISPFEEAGLDGRYELIFYGDNTVSDLNTYPAPVEYDEDDFITINYPDEVKVIKLSDLRDGKLDSLR